MTGYGRGRLRPATPDEEQVRPERRGKRQIGADIPVALYAELDGACRRADVSFAHAIRTGLRLWIRTQEVQRGHVR